MNQHSQDCQKLLALPANRTTLANIGQVFQVIQSLDAMLPSSDDLKMVIDRLSGLAGRGLLTCV